MNTYKITHAYAEGDVQYVTSNMNPEEFELLLAYITFNGEDINVMISSEFDRPLGSED